MFKNEDGLSDGQGERGRKKKERETRTIANIKR
jgi:hypothetical protein